MDSTTTTVCETATLTAVPVTNGEFAVTIPAVSEACVKGKDVHPQIAVRQETGSFTVLGKQRARRRTSRPAGRCALRAG